jgi:hypothetical protein
MKQHVINKMKIESLGNDLKEIYLISDKCIRHLIKEGEDPNDAEDIVLEILKECHNDLLNKRYDLVKLTLKTIFLPQK